MRTRVAITTATLPVMALAAAALGAAWTGVTAVGLAAAGAVALLGLARAVTPRNLAGVEPRPLPALTTRAGQRLEVPVHLRAPRARGRDLVLQFVQGRGRAGSGHIEGLEGGRGRAVVPVRFRTRGVARRLTLDLASSYPFGLLTATRRFELEADVLVLPRLGRVQRFEELLANARQSPHPRARERRSDGDFHALREWRPGLSLRGVHWKLSARRGRVLLRELRGEEESSLRILLVLEFSARSAGTGHPSFERAVSLAATLVHEAAQRGLSVRFECTGDSSPGTPRRGRAAGEHERRLATVTGRAAVPPTTVAGRREEPTLVVCTSSGAMGGPPRLEGGPGVVLDVDSEGLARWYDGTPAEATAPQGVYA